MLNIDWTLLDIVMGADLCSTLRDDESGPAQLGVGVGGGRLLPQWESGDTTPEILEILYAKRCILWNISAIIGLT